MNIYAKSDGAILREMAGRIRRRRLDLNMTQQNLADKVGLNRTTIRDVELGKSYTILTLIQILRGLEVLDELEKLLPEKGPSPLQMLKMQGKVRQRASSKSGSSAKGKSEW